VPLLDQFDILPGAVPHSGLLLQRPSFELQLLYVFLFISVTLRHIVFPFAPQTLTVLRSLSEVPLGALTSALPGRDCNRLQLSRLLIAVSL